MTFSKEQLIARINQVTAINKYRISREQDADGLAMDNELFSIALASLEAEPVAYIRDGFRADGVHFCGGIITAEEHERTKPALSDRYTWKHQPLYTAPPAPVAVMDEAQSRELFEKNCMANTERNKWHPELYAHIPAREQWAVWEACRNAMLRGADGNSPVIPDGWKLVPIELTGDMTNAMSEAILDDLHNVDVWRSVLAAAPQQEVK